MHGWAQQFRQISKLIEVSQPALSECEEILTSLAIDLTNDHLGRREVRVLMKVDLTWEAALTPERRCNVLAERLN